MVGDMDSPLSSWGYCVAPFRLGIWTGPYLDWNGGQNGDAHFPLCGPEGLFTVLVCLFTTGLRTIPLRRIVVNT